MPMKRYKPEQIVNLLREIEAGSLDMRIGRVAHLSASPTRQFRFCGCRIFPRPWERCGSCEFSSRFQFGVHPLFPSWRLSFHAHHLTTPRNPFSV